MAMSDTTSSPVNEWIQLYRRTAVAGQAAPPVRGGGSSAVTMFGGQVLDATVVTTTATSASPPSPLGTSNSGATTGHLNPDGRVSKPPRRRSRASRRTPTTLLNTDTTNFRAMVQQFTGGPSASLSSRSQIGAPNLSFGVEGHQQHLNTASFMVPFNYHQQQQQQPQQQQQQQLQYYQQEQYISPMNRNNTGEVFLPSFNNPRSSLENTEGFFMENVSSLALPRTASSNDNRNNGYIS